MSQPSWFQRFLLPGFAFKAVVIGGGYATGRELAEFFVPAGPWGGLAAMALSTILFSLFCVVTFLFARMTGSADYRSFFRNLVGPLWPVFETAYVFSFILVLAVYSAAAGEIGESMFGWPPLAGVLCLIAGIAAFTTFGNRSVEWLFKYASFFLYAVYILFVIFTLNRFGSQAVQSFAIPSNNAGWALAGTIYASYNVVAAVVILPVLRHMTSNRDAVIAGLLAGPLTMIAAVLFFLCMMAWYPQIGAEVLPADFMLRQLGLPLLHATFQFMIFMALLQSGVSSVHAINERIAGYLNETRQMDFSPTARFVTTSVPSCRRDLRCPAIRPRQPDLEGLSRVGLDDSDHIHPALDDIRRLAARQLAKLVRCNHLIPMESLMRAILVALLLVLPALAAAAPPRNFNARVDSVMKASEVPGAAIAIVENGKVTLAHGYGVLKLGGSDAVGADTLFQIGSTTKAVTAAALAILVDEGKIRWDDRVIDHLPGFRMYDPWVTREITIRDLLVHRSGLGRGQGDLLFVPATDISRADLVRRIQFLKPATSFRSGFAYDNVLYAVAGQLIESVTGQTWEDFVEARIFGPAGMKTSVTNDVDRLSAPGRAFPHGRMGELRGIGPQQPLDEQRAALGANVGPAGAIAAGANDLARWLAVQLAAGQLPGSEQRLFSAASAEEMWRPVVPVPITPLPPALAEAMPQFRGYALGWSVQDYRGHKIIQHGGGTLGFRAVVVLIPGKNVGFAIVNNSEDNEFVPGLQYELLDHYLGLPRRDWPAAFRQFFAERNTAGLEAMKSAAAARPQSSPALPLAGYAGTYEDPWYGKIEIRESAGALSIKFLRTPGMIGPLEPWAYDTFIVRWPDPLIEPAFVSFTIDAQGKPERIRMKAVSPVADFSFDYHDLEFTPVTAP